MLTLRTDEDFLDSCHPTKFPAMQLCVGMITTSDMMFSFSDQIRSEIVICQSIAELYYLYSNQSIS